MNRRTALLALATMLFVAATATASILIITSRGYYTLSENALGVPVIQKVDQVIRLSGDPDDPTDPPPPTDGTYDQLARISGEEFSKVGDAPEVGKVLSMTYKSVADAVESGQVTPDKAFEAISKSTDMLLTLNGSTQKWKPWRDAVTAELVQLRQIGKLTSKDDTVSALRAIRRGLEGQGLFDNLDIEKIIKLMTFVFKILAMFGILPGGPIIPFPS